MNNLKDKVTFVHNGMEIYNPFISSCGRFEESPKYYGFYEFDSGGNSIILRKDVDGGYILLSDLSGLSIPTSYKDALIGLYDNNDESIIYAHEVEL